MKRLSAAFLSCLILASLVVVSAGAISDEDERLIVPSGALANIARIEVYPAYYENNKKNYLEDVMMYENYNTYRDTSSVFFKLSDTQTTQLISEYESKTGRTPNAWYVVTRYEIQTDGKGSSGSYFEYSPVGKSTEYMPDSKNKIYVSGYPSGEKAIITHTFHMPENIKTERSNIGLWGGFFYNNRQNHMLLNHQSGYQVIFNDNL